MFTVGLYAATRADDPNLRAHVIADFAAQANFLGYPDDCLYIARQAEVDERIAPAVRMVIQCVKARAYALRGDADACLRHVEVAEVAHADAATQHVDGWLGTIATPAQLHAGAGHALATLARRTDSEKTRKDAQVRLGTAVAELDPVDQARTASLCLAQLAALHLEAGELDEAVAHGHRLLDTGRGIRSSRLTEHRAVVRRATIAFAHEVRVRDLVAEMDTCEPTSGAGCTMLQGHPCLSEVHPHPMIAIGHCRADLSLVRRRGGTSAQASTA